MAERKEWAKDKYLLTDKNNRTIAEETKVDEATLQKWINDEKWNDLKRSLLVSRKTQLQRYYRLLEEMDEKIRMENTELNIKNLDAIAKLTAAISNLEDEDQLCPIIEVAEQFTGWLAKKDLELARRVSGAFDSFIKEKIAA